MKRILTLLLALIVFASFALCSCGGNQTTTTTTTTGDQTPDPTPALDIEELIQNILSGNFEAIELSLPGCEITAEGLGNLFYPQVGTAATPFDKIVIKDNTVYFPCDGVDGFDQNDELAGVYFILEDGKIHLVNYMSSEEKSVQTISIEDMISEMMGDFMPSDGSGEIIPGVGDISDLKEMLDPIIEKINAAIEGIPELKEEHKLYLQVEEGTKYRIDKDYFKEVIEYVYDAAVEIIEDVTGEPLDAEIPEEVWAIVDMMTIEVDVTENLGVLVAVDALVGFDIPNEGGFCMTLHAGAEGAQMSFDFEAPEMKFEYHIESRSDSIEISCNLTSEEMTMNMAMTTTVNENAIEYAACVDMSQSSGYSYGDGDNNYSVVMETSVGMDVDMKLDLSKMFTNGATWLEYNLEMDQLSEYTRTTNGVVESSDSQEMSMDMSMTGATSDDGACSLDMVASNDGVEIIDASITIKLAEVTVPDISGVIKSAE